LPAYGACDLGSINLTQFVDQPFTRQATLNLRAIDEVAGLATRFLDNVIDLSRYPLPEQAAQARDVRRLGLGLTGLGDALLMLSLHYDSDAARAQARDALEAIRDGAYRTAIQLAQEKGSFPGYSREAYLAGAYVSSLPADIRDGIARHGIRNSHLIAVAPTGSISLLANNISSGIEPVFSLEAKRRILNRSGHYVTHDVVDYAFDLWRRECEDQLPMPDFFVTAQELSPEAHLQMQAALQPLVDNAISKTINVSEETPREIFASIYERAYQLGLKGCTVFRPNPVTGAILSPAADTSSAGCT
jgi:ribonucleoside-diphosphate reductase alpha chain